MAGVFDVCRRAAGAVFILTVLAAPAAADPFVKCVQQQLAELGYDPGRRDGRLTQASVQAGQQLQQARSASKEGARVSVLPPLTQKTAIQWCRELPALKPGLRAHMPSAAPVQVLAESDNVEKGVRRAHGQTLKFMEREYGIVLAGSNGIAAAGNVADLQAYVRKLLKQSGAPGFNADAAIAARCKDPFGVAGAAYLRFMYICWDNPHTADREWLKRAKYWLGPMMAHEYMHLVQAEFGGARSEGWNGAAVRRRMGPSWLVEGSAELVAARFRKKVLRRKPPGLSELREAAAGARKSLQAMRGPKTVRSGAEYDLSHFAVDLLVRISSEEAMFGFWRQLGRGAGWEQAFEASFGIGLGEFEAQAMEARKSTSAARAFVSRNRRSSS